MKLQKNFKANSLKIILNLNIKSTNSNIKNKSKLYLNSSAIKIIYLSEEQFSIEPSPPIFCCKPIRIPLNAKKQEKKKKIGYFNWLDRVKRNRLQCIKCRRNKNH